MYIHCTPKSAQNQPEPQPQSEAVTAPPESDGSGRFSLTYRPPAPEQRTATPTGEYSISRGVGTDGDGKKFLAGGQGQQRKRLYQWGANSNVVGKTDPQNLSYSGAWQDSQGTIEDLAAHIAKGHPWMPSLLDGNRKRWQKNANRAAVLGVDIDAGMTLEQAKCHPFISTHAALIQPSASHTPEHHKFRIVFALSQPIEGWQLIRVCNQYLAHLVGAGDAACKDASRFFFGAKGSQPELLQVNAQLPPSFVQDAQQWHESIEAEAQRRAEESRRHWLEYQAQNPDLDTDGLVRGALAHIDPNLPHNEWVAIGMALCGMGGHWFADWDGWSAGGASYVAREMQGRWKSFRGKSAAPEVIFGIAKRHGWQFPKKAKGYSVDRPKPNLTAIAGGGTGKGKSKAQKRRERKEIQAREVHHAILHPWGDRGVDYVAHSVDEALAYLLANPFTMIDGITAAGKTVLIAQLLKLLEEQGYSRDDFFPFTPIRSLARSAAAKFDLPYRGCIHSIAAIAPLMLKREKSVAIYDEVEQDLFALHKSNLCEANRLYKIELHERAIQRSDRIVLASATANLKDVAYFEGVKGERFKIMRYAPAIPSKGELTMYTGDSAVKGSQKFARAKVEAMATTRSYVATDSLRKAIEMEQRLTEGLQPGNTAPILACSRTGDDDLVQAITRSTNGGQVLADLGCPGVIATSFIQSGVSFQNPEGVQLFDLAVGTYGGHTISPADAFQQIERPRMAIPRHIFAPSYAKPPQRLARSLGQWDSDVAALEDATAIGAFKDFKYASGAVKDWCKAWEAQMQIEYSHYAGAIGAYAERNGYQVKWEVCTDEAEIQDYRDDVDRALATPIVNAYRLDYHRFRSLMEKPEPTVAEQDEIEAYLIREYYGLDWDAPLTVDQVISEGFGKGRKALKAALRATFAGTAADDDRKQREKLGDGGFIWDTTAYELEQIWADRIGLDEVLAYCLSNPRGIQVPQIREFADRLAAVQDQIGEGSKIFGHKIPWRVLGQEEQHYGEVMKWIGMVLKNKFGVASTSTRHRTPEGITTVYQCNQDDVDRLKAAVERKAESQIEKGFYPRSTPLAKAFYGGVDRAYPTADLWGNTWYVGTREGKTWHCPIGLDPADPQNWMSFAA